MNKWIMNEGSEGNIGLQGGGSKINYYINISMIIYDKVIQC